MHKKLVLNAVIESMIMGNVPDKESVVTLIEFAHKIPVSKELKFEYNSEKTNTNEQIVGNTPEHGNVGISSEENERKKITHGWFVERVGNYKIWREEDNRICFRNWRNEFNSWGKDDDEESEITYYLTYDTETFEPLSFGHIEVTKERIFFLTSAMEFLSFLVQCFSNCECRIVLISPKTHYRKHWDFYFAC